MKRRKKSRVRCIKQRSLLNTIDRNAIDQAKDRDVPDESDHIKSQLGISPQGLGRRWHEQREARRSRRNGWKSGSAEPSQPAPKLTNPYRTKPNHPEPRSVPNPDPRQAEPNPVPEPFRPVPNPDPRQAETAPRTRTIPTRTKSRPVPEPFRPVPSLPDTYQSGQFGGNAEDSINVRGRGRR
jgi:hypothetical protein